MSSLNRDRPRGDCVAGPVPGIFDGLAIPYVLRQSICGGVDTRYVVTGIVEEFALADVLVAHREHLGAAWLVFTTHSGVGMPRRAQVRLRPCLPSRLVASNRA